MTEFGPWTQCQTLRERLGLRKTELAELAGISRSYLTRLESGERWPTPYVTVKIARAFGVPAVMIERRPEEPPACQPKRIKVS